jgi:hypothetical protein
LDENDDDDNERKFTKEEYEIIPSAIELCHISFSFVQTISRLINSQQPSPSPPTSSPSMIELISWFEKLKTAVESLQSDIDNFVYSLYPPQNKQNIQTHIRKMETSFEIIIKLIENSDQLVKDPKVAKLLDTVKQTVQKLIKNIIKNDKNNNNNP